MTSSQPISFSQQQTTVLCNTNKESDSEISIIETIWQENIPSTLTDATNLPNEVWHHIISFFDDKTLLCFARVCKQSGDLVTKQPAERRVLALAKAASYQLRKDRDLADYAFIMIALTETLLNKRDQAEITSDAIKGGYFKEQAHYLIEEILLIDSITFCNCDHIPSLRNQFSDQYDDNLHDEISLLQIKRLSKEKRFDEAKELLIDVENLALGLQGMDSISLAMAENGRSKEALEIYDIDTDFIDEETNIESFTQEPKCKLFLSFAKYGQMIEDILPLFQPNHETISETLYQLEPLFQYYLPDLLFAMCLFAKTEMDNERLENATLLMDLSREFAISIHDGNLVYLLAKQQYSVGLKFEAIATLKQSKHLLDKTTRPSLAILEFDLGLVDEAEVTLNRAKEYVKAHWSIHNIVIFDEIAKAEQHLNKNEEAITTIQEAKKIAEKETTNFLSFVYKLEKGWLSDVCETARKLGFSQKNNELIQKVVESLIDQDQLDEAKVFFKESSFSGLKLARLVASVAKKEHAKGDLDLALETLSLITVPVYRIHALLSLISPKNLFDFDFSEDFKKRLEGGTPNVDDDGIDEDLASHINDIKKHLAKGISILRASS